MSPFFCTVPAILLITLVLSGYPTPGQFNDSSVKIMIEPGTETCLFENFIESTNVWIEYSVVYSSHRDHQTNFQLIDPLGRPIISEFHKSSSTHFLPVKTTGHHKMCFDNTGNRYAKKTISFTITSKNPANVQWGKYNMKNLVPEATDYEGQITYIKEVLDKLRLKLTEVQALQDSHRILESRDRSIAESNFDRVNFWSSVFIICVLCVGTLQVYFVRSFFEDKSAVRKFMNYGRTHMKY